MDDAAGDPDLRDLLGAGRREVPAQRDGIAGSRAQPPLTLPGYTIGRVLGTGSSGRVWAGVREDGLGVAVKVVTAKGGDLTPAMREAAALSRVRHDHVVRLHDVVPLPPAVPGGAPRLAMVMQVAEGGSLAQVVRERGHLTPGEVVTVLCPLATALHELHRLGIVHGDVSPSNVLFLDSGRPVLADLGLCRVTGEADRSGSDVDGTDGMVAPEVLDGWPPTPASDVYAVGALAWHCLTGRHPGYGIDRSTLTDLRPDLDGSALLETVDAALQTDPDERPEADELAARLYAAHRAEPLVLASDHEEGRGLTHRIRSREHRAVVASHGRSMRRPLLVGVVGLLALVLLGLAAVALWPGGGDAVRSGVQEFDPPTSAPTVTDAPTPGAPAAVDERSGPRTLPAPAPAPAPASTVAADATADDVPVPGWDDAVAADRVQTLVDARAEAWQGGEGAGLLAALAPDSPALQQDAAALARAGDQGLDYRGLSFDVQEARTTGERGDRVVIEARIVRSGYEVVTGGRGAHSATVAPTVDQVAGSGAERVELEIVDTEDGWRVWAWQ